MEPPSLVNIHPLVVVAEARQENEPKRSQLARSSGSADENDFYVPGVVHSLVH